MIAGLITWLVGWLVRRFVAWFVSGFLVVVVVVVGVFYCRPSLVLWSFIRGRVVVRSVVPVTGCTVAVVWLGRGGTRHKYYSLLNQKLNHLLKISFAYFLLKLISP